MKKNVKHRKYLLGKEQYNKMRKPLCGSARCALARYVNCSSSSSHGAVIFLVTRCDKLPPRSYFAICFYNIIINWFIISLTRWHLTLPTLVYIADTATDDENYATRCAPHVLPREARDRGEQGDEIKKKSWNKGHLSSEHELKIVVSCINTVCKEQKKW